MTLRAAAVLLAVPILAHAGERRIPFWPDAVPDAIQAQVDGIAALETVRELGRFHRVHGSPGFAAAAEHMRAKAEAAGLPPGTGERLPARRRPPYGPLRPQLAPEPPAGPAAE